MYDSHLWTKRLKWIKGKKFKGCIFCGIVEGNKKIPQKVIYKNKDLAVIMNLFPYNVGHLQVIPARHVKSPEDMTDEEIKILFSMVKKVMKMQRKALNPVGFNIGINVGDVAGASIEHFHIHIVPRYKHDSGFMESTCSTKVMPESLDITYRKLMKYVEILKK